MWTVDRVVGVDPVDGGPGVSSCLIAVPYCDRAREDDLPADDRGGRPEARRPAKEKVMITVKDNSLVFAFPGVHRQARLTIEFQRTLRIPDDGEDYPLPPGLGQFPLFRVEELGGGAPAKWRETGGTVLPMYQSEAMWIHFDSTYLPGRGTDYPFAVKISAGRLNAVSGEPWRRGLHRGPQDYLVVPDQPWLDGFCVERGMIRQFVAMPLGSGYSGEEQLVSGERWGGLRIAVHPMKRESFERLFPRLPRFPSRYDASPGKCFACCQSAPSMGLAAGGRMRQEVYEDGFKLSDWDRKAALACHVHIANSLAWSAVTGTHPPLPPPTAEEYGRYGLPWFEWYDDKQALEGAAALAGLKSVAEIDRERGLVSLPENASTTASRVVSLGPRAVRRRVKELSA